LNLPSYPVAFICVKQRYKVAESAVCWHRQYQSGSEELNISSHTN